MLFDIAWQCPGSTRYYFNLSLSVASRNHAMGVSRAHSLLASVKDCTYGRIFLAAMSSKVQFNELQLVHLQTRNIQFPLHGQVAMLGLKPIEVLFEWAVACQVPERCTASWPFRTSCARYAARKCKGWQTQWIVSALLLFIRSIIRIIPNPCISLFPLHRVPSLLISPSHDSSPLVTVSDAWLLCMVGGNDCSHVRRHF